MISILVSLADSEPDTDNLWSTSLMAVDLGQIKKVRMHDLWKHEEQEFTPWLAAEENIKRLADALGLELEVEGVEVPVGPFSADVLAKDVSGNYVLIENQFGKTNHDHLGKLLTYAATLNVNAIVWLAERFTDEHRKAMEWLNEHTSDDLSLYAVEVEVWQIDNSKPALRFNVLSQPTEITRQGDRDQIGRSNYRDSKTTTRILETIPPTTVRAKNTLVSPKCTPAILV
jgi:hypothetical protein